MLVLRMSAVVLILIWVGLCTAAQEKEVKHVPIKRTSAASG